jgi:predicted lipoprotein with Yx(FWY)xxD motif
LAVLFALIAACGGSGSTTTTAGPSTTEAPGTTAGATTTTAAVTTTAAETTTTEAAAGLSVMAAATDLGTILVDSDGRTLYLFTPDDQGEPTCTGDCATNWPPLTAAVTAGEGVDAALLGTASTGQVTYNGWPLYYFAADANPGDINGQGVGGVWFVIDPAGNAIE